jgi:uncharacterized protein
MKFVVTQEMGKLAKWLRILGYDTEYFTQKNVSSLIIQALRDDRIILTRNHRLPKSAGMKILFIKSETVKRQVREVLKQLKMPLNCDMMFRRCILCNVELSVADKEAVKGRVPAYVFETARDFFICPECRRIYWQGTHWGNVKKTLEELDA